MAFPLIAVAASLVPEIVRALARDRAGTLAGEVAGAVREVAWTDDPAAVRAALAADAGKADALRHRLAAIAREAELEALRAGLSGTRAARDAAVPEGPRGGGRLAWGPATVSSLVVIGFFAVVILLVTMEAGPEGAARFDPQVASVINITVGSLGAAFAAVVNFWIGSSQSSRDKDAIVGRLQEARMETHSRQVREAVAALREAPLPLGAVPFLRDVAAPTAEDRFDACLRVVLGAEGGFVNHPADPGGATNMGITRRTLSEFRDEEASEADVRALTRAEAREIYRARYWTPMRCAELPAGVDLMVFDFGVNAGPGRSLRVLQRAAGVAADGSVGPITLAAARACRAPDLIGRLAEARLAYYRGLGTFPSFGRGWTRRVEETRRAALEMAGAPSAMAA